ncbi:hypothetical protein [Vreelandella olivaria]|uniref:hypothetical protein n=1 Tax=Vreelandella olivaria TaxID=390919 RepID=UPI00201F1CC1|nr:hypothetical protein [Halomonas olivaria]
MDWVSEIIWPLLIAFMSVIFRKPIEVLFGRLVRFKYKELSLEFESPLQFAGSSSDHFMRYWSTAGESSNLDAIANLAALHDLGKHNHVFQSHLQKR